MKRKRGKRGKEGEGRKEREGGRGKEGEGRREREGGRGKEGRKKGVKEERSANLGGRGVPQLEQWGIHRENLLHKQSW